MLNLKVFPAFRSIYLQLDSPLRWRFWGIIALSVLAGIAEFVLTAAVSLLGVVLASPQTIMEMAIVKHLASQFSMVQFLLGDQRYLLAAILAVLCVSVLCKSIVLALLAWRQGCYNQAVSLDIGCRLFQNYLRAPYLWHVGQKVTDLVTDLGWRSFLAGFFSCAMQAFTQVAVILILLATVFTAAPVVGCLVMFCSGTCAILVFRFTRNRINELNSISAQAEQGTAQVSHPALYGIREVIIYRQQQTFYSLFRKHNKDYATAQSLLPVIHPLQSWVLEVVGMLMLLVAVLYMNAKGAPIARTTGVLTLLAAVAWRLMPALNRFIGAVLYMQGYMPYVCPVLNRLDEVEKFQNLSLPEGSPCVLAHELELRDVSFRYPNSPDSKPDALRHISMRIPRGRMVGIVGTSGAGKSTIVGLLTGLFSPSSGELLVDGRSMTSDLRAGWGQSLGYVPQNPFLLNASIAENVAFSQWGNDIDRERVLRCCGMAAMDFIHDLADGIDTIIGERGVRLSGGQVQRVSIARALYDNPQLIIFDEATSALDGATEAAIQYTVNGLRDIMTSVVIAHRLATVESCDYIYWLADGEIKKEGPSSEVLAEYEHYLDVRAQELRTSHDSIY